MNAHQFSKLTRRQQLEHITRAKRASSGKINHEHYPKLNGVRVGTTHPTKQAALTEGRQLLIKYKTEAQNLGIPVNQ